MTEVVTSSAAIPQLNLLAARQQVFVVDRQDAINGGEDNAASHQISPPRLASAPQLESSGHHDSPEQKQADQSARNNSNSTGPSRARVEIRSMDIGLTPSEVVGTPDVLQRFDSNGDGRVDLMEAERASLVRVKGTTFAGLAAAPRLTQPALPEITPPTSEAAPVTLPDAPKKLFTPADAAEAIQPKKVYADAVTVAQGTVAAVVDVPKKLYGQGAEVVVSPAIIAEAPKLHEKIVVQDRVFTESDTGETKLYDKVAQTDTDQNPDTSGGSGELYERAQREAAATNDTKKTVVVEVAAYANTAATVDTPAPAATTTVVTA